MGEKRHTIITEREPKVRMQESTTRNKIVGSTKIEVQHDEKQTTIIPSPKVKSPFGKNRQFIVQSENKIKVTPLVGTVEVTVQDKTKRLFVKDRR